MWLGDVAGAAAGSVSSSSISRRRTSSKDTPLSISRRDPSRLLARSVLGNFTLDD
jgi:hypothetical protein